MASSSYFLPAIFLNPVVILHGINTYFSYHFPPISSFSTTSHPTVEKFGPLPGSTPFFNLHANENLCWTYTVIMVFAQLLAYTKIGSNRLRKKSKLRRDGKKIAQSRWSESEESPKLHMDTIRKEKTKERDEMNDERRKSEDIKPSTALDGANDSPTRRQVRSIRYDRSRYDQVGDAEFMGKAKEGGDTHLESVEEHDDKTDEDTSETSDDAMIL